MKSNLTTEIEASPTGMKSDSTTETEARSDMTTEIGRITLELWYLETLFAPAPSVLLTLSPDPNQSEEEHPERILLIPPMSSSTGTVEVASTSPMALSSVASTLLITFGSDAGLFKMVTTSAMTTPMESGNGPTGMNGTGLLTTLT